MLRQIKTSITGASMLRSAPIVLSLLFAFAPDKLLACGSTAQQFWSYTLEADKSKLESFLREQSCASEAKYSPVEAEPYIALVLINAIDAGVPRETIESVFKRYNCASTVRNRSAYRKIVDFLGEERFSEVCDLQTLRRMYVVRATGGANVRSEANKQAAKVGVVAEGALVKNGKIDGDWILVETYSGTGYMHSSTLIPYYLED